MTTKRVFVSLALSLWLSDGDGAHAANAGAPDQVGKASEKSSAWPAPPRPLPLDKVSRVLHVAPSHSEASDRRDGGTDTPFATIQAAVDFALKSNGSIRIRTRRSRSYACAHSIARGARACSCWR